MNRGFATIHQSLLGAREALCACALQIIRILFEALRALRVFLPVKFNF
jgi:hypothetical protein